MDYKAPARHHDELGQTIYMVKANTFLSCDEPSQHKYRKSETRKEDAKHQIENPSREPDCIIRPIPVQFPEVLQGTSEA